MGLRKPEQRVCANPDTPATPNLHVVSPPTIVVLDASLKFRDAALVWLETRRPYLAASTFHDYEKYIGTLFSFFGNIGLRQITADHVRAYQRTRMARAGASI